MHHPFPRAEKRQEHEQHEDQRDLLGEIPCTRMRRASSLLPPSPIPIFSARRTKMTRNVSTTPSSTSEGGIGGGKGECVRINGGECSGHCSPC